MVVAGSYWARRKSADAWKDAVDALSLCIGKFEQFAHLHHLLRHTHRRRAAGDARAPNRLRNNLLSTSTTRATDSAVQDRNPVRVDLSTAETDRRPNVPLPPAGIHWAREPRCGTAGDAKRLNAVRKATNESANGRGGACRGPIHQQERSTGRP